MFWADNFPKEWQRFVQSYNLKPGDTVWIVQTGWGVDLPADLQKHFAEFHDLHFESFGKNIKIFRMTVGQPMPATARVGVIQKFAQLKLSTFTPIRKSKTAYHGLPAG